MSFVVHLYCNNIFLGQQTPTAMKSACLKWDQFSFPRYQYLSFSHAAKFLETSFYFTHTHIRVRMDMCIYVCMTISAESGFVRRNLKKLVVLRSLWRWPCTQEPQWRRVQWIKRCIHHFTKWDADWKPSSQQSCSSILSILKGKADSARWKVMGEGWGIYFNLFFFTLNRSQPHCANCFWNVLTVEDSVTTLLQVIVI